MKKKARIYLDHAAATPVSKSVLKEMEPYFSEEFGNPSSLHSFGQKASRAVDLSRERVAKMIGAEFREIIFTGSATEANNLALRGVLRAYRTNRSNWSNKSYRIIVSAVEHESVLETARDLAASFQGASLDPKGRERDGAEVVYIPVDKNGVVDVQKLEASLDENTILVSVMYGNNVTGTIQPIAKIANIIKRFSDAKKPRIHANDANNSRNSHVFALSSRRLPLFHTDAVQAFQYLNCNVNDLGVDMMTISSHKIYGPKGVGALYARTIDNKQLTINKKRGGQMSNVKGQLLSPLVTGGGQEFGLRSGTENIPTIVGFARAAEEAVKIREKETKRLEKLKECLWKEIKKFVPSAIRNAKDTKTLPHILNVSFPGASKNFVARLDTLGVAVSSGAACSARSQEASYVLLAMAMPEELARRSIRFSLGRKTTEGEIRKTAQRIKITFQHS